MSSSVFNELTMSDVWEHFSGAFVWLWSKTTRRLRAAAVVIILVLISLSLFRPIIPQTRLPYIPKVRLEYTKEGVPLSPYNDTKVALLIENRANPILAPLMLHFMAVAPPDWRFRFMGSVESVEFVNSSRAIRDQVAKGKLDLTYIPANMSTGSSEEISTFLTTLWLYETVLAPAETLLVYQTDSMICANSRQSLNDWLDYDWVGAPWDPNGRYGGNGGLSMRNVAAIKEILRNQQRAPYSDPEDVWLAERLAHRPGAKMANGTTSLIFSGEMYPGKGESLDTSNAAAAVISADGSKAGGLVKGIDEWREGFYEPMGYHTGNNGKTLHSAIWGTPELRKHVWNYCPEVKMILNMDVERYIPGDCHSVWKRWDAGEGPDTIGDLDMFDEYAYEVIDGEEYPVIPVGLVPW